MPSNLMFADASFPKIEVGEDPQESIRKIQNYLFMLLEQLRYTLQNLGEGNFNDAEMQAYFKKLSADLIVAQTVISNTVITNELYADYGAIADLTVDKLRTDYKRAQKYLAGDTSQLDYISIHDEEISFITATTDGTQAQQMEVSGRKFWWRDKGRTQMTSEQDTGDPVMVYVYEERTKAAFRFRPVEYDGVETVMPVLVFGAGSGQAGDAGRALVEKRPYGLDLRYIPTGGQGEAGVYLRDDGFADVTHRRADVSIDTAGKTITISPEGVLAEAFDIAYAEEGDTLTLTWPDGKAFRVVKR